MTQAVAPPPGAPAPAPAPRGRRRPGGTASTAAPAAHLRARRRPLQSLRAALRTTAGRYRLWSLAAALALVAGALVAALAANTLRTSTHRAAANSGPVLVATQQLVSSLAEADAAATAAFLSGANEDPEQRRLYEQALARSNQQLEQIAALVGDDAAVHATIQRVGIQVTRYAGLVEAARVTNKAAGADADELLTSAVRLVDSIVSGDVASLTTATQRRLADDASAGGSGVAVAVLVLLGGLAVLAGGQLAMTRTSRRILNIPLVVASVLVLAALVTLVRADRDADHAQRRASTEGFDSVALSVRLATAGFGTKASETLALISGSAAERTEAREKAAEVSAGTISQANVDAIRRGEPSGLSGLLAEAAGAAGNPRERAAVAEAALRWQRYRDAVATSSAAAVAQSGAAFNGFNFTVESLLGQNRAQFLDGLDEAADTTKGVPVTLLAVLGVAVLAMFWGYQLRIDDYR